MTPTVWPIWSSANAVCSDSLFTRSATKVRRATWSSVWDVPMSRLNASMCHSTSSPEKTSKRRRGRQQAVGRQHRHDNVTPVERIGHYAAEHAAEQHRSGERHTDQRRAEHRIGELKHHVAGDQRPHPPPYLQAGAGGPEQAVVPIAEHLEDGASSARARLGCSGDCVL